MEVVLISGFVLSAIGVVAIFAIEGVSAYKKIQRLIFLSGLPKKMGRL